MLFLFTGSLPSETVNPPKVMTSPLYPCSVCHDGIKTVPLKRKLSFHEDIILNHDSLWCLDCHNILNRNRLNSSQGKTVDFRELPVLCGVCHGRIYTQWSKGVHGKRTGEWNGRKNYFICTDCHSPHSPRFRPLKPEPPPLRPEKTLRRY